jgi:hypothetical protein
MGLRVVIFEDLDDDRRRFEESFRVAGVEVLVIPNQYVERVEEEVRAFAPQMAVIDSHFQADVDGFEILRKLIGVVPNIRVVVCTVLLNDPAKKQWVTEKYNDAPPNFRALLPKIPFPSAEDILFYAQD